MSARVFLRFAWCVFILTLSENNHDLMIGVGLTYSRVRLLLGWTRGWIIDRILCQVWGTLEIGQFPSLIR